MQEEEKWVHLPPRRSQICCREGGLAGLYALQQVPWARVKRLETREAPAPRGWHHREPLPGSSKDGDQEGGDHVLVAAHSGASAPHGVLEKLVSFEALGPRQ
ncbi:hypothetical protein P7K49_012045 [Saguinus oedipus]|uniref:Uncharacterized protein n=1 Tax=Saguinus oedipus TaxID=9490 RepID=A0ABQ9VUS8_SAGOE|nr:hypothetical protein P7K49_012045 [Saguinus oedipus]